MGTDTIKAVVFDFGGVLAEEGFREGLKAIGKENGLDPDYFYATANELIHRTGYVTGESDESTYWDAVRQETAVRGSDEELREKILQRFLLRPKMIEYVERLKNLGYTVAILSDQTNWLDEINGKTPFCHRFDHVFNSFRIGKSKRDRSVFRDICSAMRCNPAEVLFIDDNGENIAKASEEGLRTIHFRNMDDFGKEIGRIVDLG